ncbi:MAG: peptidylprolyl isomerase [Nitrospirota bacterium]
MKVFRAGAVLASALFPLGALAAEAGKENKIAAYVNGVPVLARDVEEAVSAKLPSGSMHGRVASEKKQQYWLEATKGLVAQELIVQAGRAAGIRVEPAEVTARLKEVRSRYPSPEAYKEAIRARGLTPAAVKKRLEREILVEKAVRLEVDEKVRVSEEDARRYYARNPERFNEPEKVRLRHILVRRDPAVKEGRDAARRKAEGLVARIKGGGDFEALARSESDDPSREQGGDLGLVHKGRLMPAVEEAAFRLKPGVVSDLVETIYGFHILKVEARVPETRRSFDSIKGKLIRDLGDLARQDRLKAWIETLSTRAVIRYVDQGAESSSGPRRSGSP